MEPKHLHFIGICGVAMSALALAFKKEGWKVTGSDVGFFPPVSTHLKNAGINFYPGWHPEKMMAAGTPDLVVVGNVAGSHNPEWLYAQKHKLNYKSYPEVARDFIIKKNSLVATGTYGKTTSSGLLAWILKAAGFNPSYLFGGLISGQTMLSSEITKSDWSITEGDEYKSARWDNRPKFAHYLPTHLLLTSVVWDHADIYPTEAEYGAVFKKLIDSVPANGLKIISEKVDSHLIGANAAIRYGQGAGNDYAYGNVKSNAQGVAFDIFYQDKTWPIFIPSLGDFMADNATGVFALAHQIGIAPEVISKAIASFPGLKRRLEKRLAGAITVFDDIAHSPAKAQAILAALRKIYSKKIIAVFEPNSGNRERAALAHYAHAFVGADEVVIPRLTKIKTTPELPEPIEGMELAETIAQTHPSVQYIDDDQALILYLRKKIPRRGGVVVFLGSHGFRGMIEALIEVLRTKY